MPLSACLELFEKCDSTYWPKKSCGIIFWDDQMLSFGYANYEMPSKHSDR